MYICLSFPSEFSLFKGHLPVQEEHEEKPVLHSRRAMINALISVDDFPTTGYIGKRKGDKFVITHPDLPPPLILEP